MALTVVLISVSVIVAEVCPLIDMLLIPATAALLQVKVAAGSLEVIV